jgi:hypothetical protein
MADFQTHPILSVKPLGYQPAKCSRLVHFFVRRGMGVSPINTAGDGRATFGRGSAALARNIDQWSRSVRLILLSASVSALRRSFKYRLMASGIDP